MTQTPTPTWEETITDILIALNQGDYLGKGGVPAAATAINKAVHRAMQEAYKKGYAQGSVDEILRHEKARQAVAR